MPFRHAARHISVRGRMAHRRIRQVLERTTVSQGLGAATVLFAAISVAAHVALTWGMIAFAPAPLPDAANDPLVASRFLYPLLKQQPRPQVERVRFIGVGRGTPSQPATVATREPTAGAGDEELVESIVELPDPDEPSPFGAFSELEVDVTAERDPESEGPVYPDSLLARAIEGEARVRFVIDATGKAIPESFGVIETTHPGFADAVRRVLPRMKFRPASMGPKAVPQRVEQSFVFKITREPVVP